MYRKAQIVIGQRLYAELQKGNSVKDICYQMGCMKSTFYSWRDGSSPAAIFLQRAIEIGIDVDYILTGKRK